MYLLLHDIYTDPKQKMTCLEMVLCTKVFDNS